jgi:hypothetical protein
MTGLSQDKERDRIKAGYGGRQDLNRIWRVTGLRQDMEGDRIKIGYGERKEY